MIHRVLDKLAGGETITMLGSFSGNRSAFQILIGTILSARSRDEMTEKACEALFRSYPTPVRLARANRQHVMSILRIIGFYRQKAKYIVETSQIIAKRYRGRVPDSFDELIALPGVGRKVANCVLVYAFGKPAIAVDTHVHRISNRIGWVQTKSPEQTERRLAKILPRRHWLTINELLVHHGKTICRPIAPKCHECQVRPWCAQRSVVSKETTRLLTGTSRRQRTRQ
jgi:endonuclease-3